MTSSVAPGRAIAALAGRESTLIVRLPFLDWTGDLYAALMLDEGLFTAGREGADGWFARTDEEWAKLFRSTVYAVRAARARLVELKLIETQRHGMPKRTFYRFNPATIESAFVAWLDRSTPAEEVLLRTAEESGEGPEAVRQDDPGTVDSAVQSFENEGSVIRNRTTGGANSESQSCENAQHSIQAGLSLKAGKGLKQTADAVSAESRIPQSARQNDNGATTTAGQAQHPDLMAALCRAAGLSLQDLTKGTRGEIGELAARIAREPRGTWPDPDQLVVIYQAELDELSARTRRAVESLTMSQFRQAIGAWFARHARENEERQARAEHAARQRELDAELACRSTTTAAAPTDAAAAWERVARGLRQNMSPASWDAWVKPIAPLALEDGVLAVEVATPMVQDWIEQRIGDQIKALAIEAGVQLRIMVHGAARDAVAA